MKILITGVGGFIGKELAKVLKNDNNFIIGITRSNFKNDLNLDKLIIQELTPYTNFSKYLVEVDIVIHLAGRVHICSKSKSKNMKLFINDNLLVTKNLLEHSLKCDVKKFLFLSTVGVHGTRSIEPFSEDDYPNPVSPYAKSKLLCENYIREFCENTKLEFSIIRSPLVYGKNAPGNLGILKKFIDYNIPLPILSLNKNKRSVISINNLIEFIKNCLIKKEAKNQTFLVSDGIDRSTLEIIKLFCVLNKCKIKLFYCPVFLISIFFIIIRRNDLNDKLIKSFQINNNKSKTIFNAP
tara:strand:- start:78 stop:965 length:888 start_codon:yes stop_codon:yes gene_type:complete